MNTTTETPVFPANFVAMLDGDAGPAYAAWDVSPAHPNNSSDSVVAGVS